MKTEVWPSRNTFKDIHDKLLIPAVYALKAVEDAGFKVDGEKLREFNVSYQEKLIVLEDTIRSYPEVLHIEARMGVPFNVNSSDQIRELLFQSLDMDCRGVKRTPTGKLSADKDTIALLKGEHDIVALINQHRKYSTLMKMFVEPLPRHLRSDGKVHCSYMLNGTVTGRLASEAPNVQQIPKNITSDDVGFDFDEALNIKLLFTSSGPEYVIFQADYSQIELRILAEYSQDPDMIQAFLDGEDIHMTTGKLLAGEDIDKTSIWRKRAKEINFGIVYGMAPETLAKRMGVSKETANKFMDAYFENMPCVKDFILDVEAWCKKHKHVTSMFGRHRRLSAVGSRDKWVRLEALRKAVNMPIQSTASDYTLCSLINLVDIFRQYKLKSTVIATVHDSIVFNVHRREVKLVAEIAKTVMMNPQNSLIYWESEVPYEVDLEVGERWGSLEKLN